MTPRPDSRAATPALLATLASLGGCQTAGTESTAPPATRSTSSRLVETDAWPRHHLQRHPDRSRRLARPRVPLGVDLRPHQTRHGRIAFIHPVGDRVAVQSEDAWTCVVEASTGSPPGRSATPPPHQLRRRRPPTTISSPAPAPRCSSWTSTRATFSPGSPCPSSSRPPRSSSGVTPSSAPRRARSSATASAPSTGAPLPPPLDDGAIKAWGYLLDGAIVASPRPVGSLAGIVTENGEVFFVDILTGSGRGYHASRGHGHQPRLRRLDHVRRQPRPVPLRLRARELDLPLALPHPDPISDQPAVPRRRPLLHVRSEGLVAFDVSQDARDAGSSAQDLDQPGRRGRGHRGPARATSIVWDGSDRLPRRPSERRHHRDVPLDGVTERLVAGEFEDGELYAVGDNGPAHQVPAGRAR
jgi:hypothetical protein